MLIQNNEELLRTSCIDVSLDEFFQLRNQLEVELNFINKDKEIGIGLAAPQIGINKKIAIIRINDHKIDLVNAKIEKAYDLKMFREEGCLSFPGRVENTERYQEIYVTNNLVYPHSFIATGLLAVAIQHELDHLNKTLFMDRAIKPKVGPNSPCMCGKNLKYKKCCGKNK